MRRLLLVPISYLLGSIAWPWIFAKIIKGVDIRQTGSGTTGGTNAARVIGFRWAAVAGALDVLKAFVPTRYAVKRWPNDHWLHLLTAGAAVFGHTKSLFLGFKGGKAVSPSAGALFALASKASALWRVFLVAIGAFITAVVGSRGRVSVGSLSGSAAAGIYATKLALANRVPRAYGLGILGMTAYIWLMHWPNIKRIFKGKEPRTIRIW